MANTNSLDLELSSSQYAQANDSATTSPTGDFTVEGWFKLESTAGGSGVGLFSKWTSGANRSFDFWWLGDVTNAFECSNSSSGTTSIDGTAVSYTLSTGTWYHIAFAYDASAGSVEIFVNGSSVGTSTGLATSIYDGPGKFTIGASTDLGTRPFDGLVDDVRLWGILRTQTEINNNKSVELVGNETNLNAYWKLNNDYTDSTANGNTLTAVNSPVFSTDVPFTGAVTFIPKVTIF